MPIRTSSDFFSLKNTQIEKILHPERDQLSFQELYPQVSWLLKMIIEMGDVLDSDIEIPTELINSANTFINDFALVMQEMEGFRIDLRNSNYEEKLKERESILNRNVNSFQSMLAGERSQLIGNNRNFLTVYNAVLSFKERNNFSPDDYKNDLLKDVDKVIDERLESIDTTLKTSTQLNTETKASLDLLNKEVGKMGVEKFAEIFLIQASYHSHSFGSKIDVDGKVSKSSLGLAQKWLIAAIILLISTLLCLLNLDKFFNVSGQYFFTPDVTVHVIGRFVFATLLIFLVSFAFKQYRINKHLHILNKHRSNTLQSFEYLTRAPDKLEPESYNAIVMEVAKAIFEAGQTGYVTSNDSNADIPSIIDMSKVINPKS